MHRFKIYIAFYAPTANNTYYFLWIFIVVRNDTMFNLKHRIASRRRNAMPWRGEKEKEQVIFSDMRVGNHAVTTFSLEDELIDRVASYRTRQITWKFYRDLHNVARCSVCVKCHIYAKARDKSLLRIERSY